MRVIARLPVLSPTCVCDRWIGQVIHKQHFFECNSRLGGRIGVQLDSCRFVVGVAEEGGRRRWWGGGRGGGVGGGGGGGGAGWD